MQSDAVNVGAVIIQGPQMISVADVPHLNRCIPRTTQKCKRNLRNKGKRTHILSVAIFDSLSPADRHWIGVSIHFPNSNSFVVTS